MKQNSIYFFFTMFILASITLFTSCSDDDKEVVDEWTYNRVYLQSTDNVSGIKTFNLSHDANGIGGDPVSLIFTVKTQKAISEDIIVYLKVKSETENFKESDIAISSKQVVIKAGETTSEMNTVTVDQSLFSAVESKASVSFSVSIEKIETSNKNTVISNNSSILSALINKAERLNMKVGSPADSKLWTDRKKWSFTFMDGVENANSNTVAATGSSDVATNGIPFWLTVDLNDAYTVTGIQTRHWSSAYAPLSVEVYTSADGKTWKSKGVLTTGGSWQNITFIIPEQIRYLKYQMLDVPSRVDLTYFLVYVQAE